jgi:tetratricopeptide (TPR) repeat protein
MSPNQCGISGRVLYGDNFKGAEGIFITLKQRGIPINQTFTTSLGRFEFRGLSQDAFVVEAEVEGYEPANVSVDLSFLCRNDNIMVMLEPQTIVRVETPAQPMISAEHLQIPDKARKAFAKGIGEMEKKNRLERSLKHFRKAIENYPEFYEAYIQLARAHMALNEEAKAVEVLEEATALEKERARAFILLGMTHYRLKQPVECLRALREGVRLDQGNWLGHFELGRSLLEYGLAEAAYPHAQKAHELNGQGRNVHLLLHNVTLQRGDYRAALAEANEFLELFPDDNLASEMRQREEVLRQSLRMTD